jgi:hypothetical protein
MPLSINIFLATFGIENVSLFRDIIYTVISGYKKRKKYSYEYALLGPSLGPRTDQAVSRWFPTAAARVRARVWSSWICGGQSGVGASFLRVLRFPLPIFITQNSPSSQSPGVGSMGQKWPPCRVDKVWTPPPPPMRI